MAGRALPRIGGRERALRSSTPGHRQSPSHSPQPSAQQQPEQPQEPPTAHTHTCPARERLSAVNPRRSRTQQGRPRHLGPQAQTHPRAPRPKHFNPSCLDRAATQRNRQPRTHNRRSATAHPDLQADRTRRGARGNLTAPKAASRVIHQHPLGRLGSEVSVGGCYRSWRQSGHRSMRVARSNMLAISFA